MSGLSSPVSVFGINNITILNYTTKVPVASAVFKVPAELIIPMSTGIEKLFGGANKYVIEAEPTYMSGEISMKFKQFDEGLWSAFAAAATATLTNESATGYTSAITNQKGTSVVAATGLTAVAGLISADIANLKTGIYTLKATGAATLAVYCSTDVDFGEGTAVAYVDNTSEIIASISISTGQDTTVIGCGVKVTGGGSATSFVTGDTATFSVRPANVSNTVITVGQSGVVYNKFSMYASAQKKGSGEIFEFYAPKVQPYGFDMPWNEYKFSEAAPKAILLQSATENMICQFTRISRVAG